MNTKEFRFINETLIAIFKGARIGKDHYTVSLTRRELLDLIKKLDREI